jgi:urease accessory protein
VPGHGRPADLGRRVEANLVFASGGGRTVLTRQYVPYPFHVTRAFYLDRERPDLATLYLQSSSGGLYRDDDLQLAIEARSGTSAHITTQAATVVHDTGALRARARVDITVESGGFLSYTPDPLVLFPGAAIDNEMHLTLATEARAIVVDSFAWHDLRGSGRPFRSLSQTLTVRDATGRLLLRDSGRLHGSDFLGLASPLGPLRASGSMLMLAPGLPSPNCDGMQQASDAAGCLTGISNLPNESGLLVRWLAADGGSLRRGIEAALPYAFKALTGIWPAPRRK